MITLRDIQTVLVEGLGGSLPHSASEEAEVLPHVVNGKRGIDETSICETCGAVRVIVVADRATVPRAIDRTLACDDCSPPVGYIGG